MSHLSAAAAALLRVLLLLLPAAAAAVGRTPNKIDFFSTTIGLV